MNYFLKQKTWFFIALFFIVMNAVLLVNRFFGKRHWHEGRETRHDMPMNGRHEGHGRDGHGDRSMYITRILLDSLGFSEEQHSRLEKINEMLDERKDSLGAENEKAKEALLQQIYAENPEPAKTDSLVKKIAALTESYNRVRIENVNAIRLVCTPQQRKRIREIFKGIHDMHPHEGRRHH